MATLLVELTVADLEGWKTRRDALAEVRAEYGERRAEVYRVADEPNRVVVLMEWASLEAARAFSESDEFLVGMDETDFVEETVRILDPVE
jgi:heme-degrading monooxygenase HmoA